MHPPLLAHALRRPMFDAFDSLAPNHRLHSLVYPFIAFIDIIIIVVVVVVIDAMFSFRANHQHHHLPPPR
jgi:predicted membrane-bound mannosyltransferase